MGDREARGAVSPEAITRDAAASAELLVEALPYIRRFSGATVVIKCGGSALPLAGPDGKAVDEGWGPLAEDLVLLRSIGVHPVVVHGGGPQIGQLMRRLGKEPAFEQGRRITDAETLDIARMVLVGKVNREIVAAVNVHGSLAVGLSGEDARLITAEARGDTLGYVGEVAEVAPELVERLLAEGLVPVVATIGIDADGQAYNINADTVAGALAAALGAEKLVFLTDVEGLRADPADPGSLLHQVTTEQLEDLMATGVASGGMAPKAEACVHAVRRGVRSAHMLDGRVRHALLVELFTDSGVGTMVVP